MKSKLIALFVSVSSFTFIPMVAAAQTYCQDGTIQGIICTANDILQVALPFLVALAVVIFVWGVVMYVVSSDEEAKKAGRDRMIWGIIGLAVIVALWGLVRIITNTFDVPTNALPNLPALPY